MTRLSSIVWLFIGLALMAILEQTFVTKNVALFIIVPLAFWITSATPAVRRATKSLWKRIKDGIVQDEPDWHANS